VNLKAIDSHKAKELAILSDEEFNQRLGQL